MKLKQIKYCLLASFLLNCMVSNSFAEGDTIRLPPPPEPKKEFYPQPLLIKTNPLAILWGPVPLTSEYRLVAEITTGRTKSAQIGISYLGISPVWKVFEKIAQVPGYYQLKVKGWRIQVAHKFYLISRRRYAPFGFYVSPNVSYSNARLSFGLNNYVRQNYYDFRHLNANLLIGVQVGRNSRITMDIFGGLGYKQNTVHHHVNNYRIIPFDTNDFGEFYNSAVKLTFGINFGYAIY